MGCVALIVQRAFIEFPNFRREHNLTHGVKQIDKDVPAEGLAARVPIEISLRKLDDGGDVIVHVSLAGGIFVALKQRYPVAPVLGITSRASVYYHHALDSAALGVPRDVSRGLRSSRCPDPPTRLLLRVLSLALVGVLPAYDGPLAFTLPLIDRVGRPVMLAVQAPTHELSDDVGRGYLVIIGVKPHRIGQRLPNHHAHPTQPALP